MDDAEFRKKAHALLVRATQDPLNCPWCVGVICRTPAADSHSKGCEGVELVVAGAPRCERCDWPLKASDAEGCVEGNCSYRPEHGSDEWARMRRRDDALRVGRTLDLTAQNVREAHRLMVEELTGDAPPANRKARVQRLLEELVDKWDGRT